MAEDAHSLLACLATLDPDHQAPPVKIEMATGAAYIRFKGINISIDDLNVNTCNSWWYVDDFSTTKAEHDSYQHSPFLPENTPSTLPFLCYTHVIYQPPNTLAFSPGAQDAADLFYRFPVFNEMPPILAYLTVLVRDLHHGGGTYELSRDGIVWPQSGRLAIGPQRIDLLAGHAAMWRYFRSVVPTDQPLTYLWNFGDGQTSTDPETWHNYAAAGTYLVTCTVTDPSGVSMTDYMYCVVP